jgi:hypothetical protein
MARGGGSVALWRARQQSRDSNGCNGVAAQRGRRGEKATRKQRHLSRKNGSKAAMLRAVALRRVSGASGVASGVLELISNRSTPSRASSYQRCAS